MLVNRRLFPLPWIWEILSLFCRPLSRSAVTVAGSRESKHCRASYSQLYLCLSCAHPSAVLAICQLLWLGSIWKASSFKDNLLPSKEMFSCFFFLILLVSLSSLMTCACGRQEMYTSSVLRTECFLQYPTEKDQSIHDEDSTLRCSCLPHFNLWVGSL